MHVQRRRSALFAVLLVALCGAGGASANEALEKTKEFLRSVTGNGEHDVALFTYMQDYQAVAYAQTRPLLVKVKIKGDDALRYFCRHQPRFLEAVLRAATIGPAAALTVHDRSLAEVGKRARHMMSRFMKEGWLVDVEASYIRSSNDAGPDIIATRDACADALS